MVERRGGEGKGGEERGGEENLVSEIREFSKLPIVWF